MLERYYIKMMDENLDQIALISEMLLKIADSRIFDCEIMTMIQNKIIELGTSIEKEYCLEDSQFIHELESAANLLYAITQNPSDDNYDSLKKVSQILPSAFKISKSVNASKLSLVLIIKNEAAYIKEWIEFHNMLGVDHFYIYDNESTDDLKNVLSEYIQGGVVTYHFWPGKVVQIPAYNHAISHYKFDTEYMGFIDTDEFLFPVKGYSIPAVIDKIFANFNLHIAKAHVAGGIGVNWRSYGTSYIKEKPEGLVIENYKLRGFDDYPQNVHIKTIIKPTMAKAFTNNPHNLSYNDSNCFTISEHGSMIPSAFFYDGHCDLLRINHYYTRSESELYYKMKVRGWADVPDELQEVYANSYKDRLNSCNDIEDDIMVRFYEPLKNRMGKKDYVSIVMPTYNRAECIRDSINSILEQTYEFFELVIVDDGSTDNTEDVVKSVDDCRIKYYKTETNKGASAARNFGIQQSNYKYIAFHDSDDTWLPQKLEKEMELLMSDESFGMVYCQMKCVNSKADSLENNIEKMIPDLMTQDDKISGNIYKYLLQENYIGIPTMVVRKSCLAKIGFLDEKYKALEDWDLALRLSKHFQVGCVCEPLYVYNMNNSDSVSLDHTNYFKARCEMVRSYKRDMIRYGILEAVIKDILARAELVNASEQVARVLDLCMQN